jgi:hypothetical protein
MRAEADLYDDETLSQAERELRTRLNLDPPSDPGEVTAAG